MHALVRSSSFSKAQGLRETGPLTNSLATKVDLRMSARQIIWFTVDNNHYASSCSLSGLLILDF